MKTCHQPPHISAAFLPPSLYLEDSERGSRKQGERLRQSTLSQQMLLLLNTKAPTNATPKANEKQRGLETPSTSTCHKMKHKSTNLNVFLPFIFHCTLCSIFQKGSLQSTEKCYFCVQQFVPEPQNNKDSINLESMAKRRSSGGGFQSSLQPKTMLHRLLDVEFVSQLWSD